MKRYKLYDLPVRKDAELLSRRGEMVSRMDISRIMLTDYKMRVKLGRRDRSKLENHSASSGYRDDLSDESSGKRGASGYHSRDSKASKSAKGSETHGRHKPKKKSFNLMGHQKGDKPLVARPPMPAPSFELGKIPQSHLGPLLESWVFLVIFRELMSTTPVVLDEFIEAISDDYERGIPRYISDSFCSLLSILCEESARMIPAIRKQLGLPNGSSKKSTASNTHERYIIDSNGMIFYKSPYGVQRQIEESGLVEVASAYSDDFDGYSSEASRLLSKYSSNYMKLSRDERNVLDNWYNWKITGKAAQGNGSYMKKKSKNKKGSATLKKSSCAGWELALVGFVRDRITIRQWPDKWEFVNNALSSASSEPDGGDTSEKAEGAAPEKQRSAKTYDNLPGDSDSSAAGGINSAYLLRKNIPQAEKDPNKNLSRAIGFGLRERQRNVTYKFNYERATLTKKGDDAFAERSKQRRWLKDAGAILKGCRKVLSDLPVTSRIFLIHFLIGSVMRGKRFGDFMNAHKERRKVLLNKKRATEMERRFVTSVKNSLIEKSLKFGKGRPQGDLEKAGAHDVETPQEQGDTTQRDISSGIPEAEYSNANNPMDQGSPNSGEGDNFVKGRLRKRKPETLKYPELGSSKSLKLDASAAPNSEESDGDSDGLGSPTSYLEKIKGLEKREDDLRGREKVFDYMLVKTASTKCCTTLGRDRYYNRYWWFDEQLGCQSPVATPEEQAPQGQPPKPDTNVWLCGYLFVEVIQDPSTLQPYKSNPTVSSPPACVPDPQAGPKNDSCTTPRNGVANGGSLRVPTDVEPENTASCDTKNVAKYASCNGDTNHVPDGYIHEQQSPGAASPGRNHAPVSNSKLIEDIVKDVPIFKAGSWVFYSDASQVDLLLKWLNPDCSSEAHLLKELQRLKSSIVLRMNKRREYTNSHSQCPDISEIPDTS